MPAHSHNNPHQDILALDVGTVRIGVARASALVRIPEVLTTLPNDQHIWSQLLELCEQHNAETLVVGLPRGLEGQETAQTALVREFVDKLTDVVGVPIALQDEALTSQKAEAELEERGKPYQKGDIDALAAVFILEDYLTSHHGKI
jgi:putative Holliday junction resolvase